jgi:hypothetical protein
MPTGGAVMPQVRKSPHHVEKKPTIAWKRGFTPWGVPCSVMLVDGRAWDSRDCFGAAVPIVASKRPKTRAHGPFE